MTLRKGQKGSVYRRSEDERWEPLMDEYIGIHGIIVDPDTSINNPFDLIEVSLAGKGSFRLSQDCLRVLDYRPRVEAGMADMRLIWPGNK